MTALLIGCSGSQGMLEPDIRVDEPAALLSGTMAPDRSIGWLAPGFELHGLVDGQVLVGSVVVEAMPYMAIEPIFEFYLDGELVTWDDEPPYCLVEREDGSCAGWDVTEMEEGAYVMEVVMDHDEGVSASEVNFTVRTTRDPALWPFSEDSPWNHPVGANARYELIESPEFSNDGGAGVNVTTWSHPVYLATEHDPVRSFDATNETWCGAISTPDDATPDPELDGHLHVIAEDRVTLIESWRAVRQESGDVLAEACAMNDLRGPGVSPVWSGVRAYGGSALGGLIRRGELVDGIPHALAVATSREALNRHTPSGMPWVWPASCADGWDALDYGEEGNLYMGSLLAIPPDVDVGALKLSPAGYQVGRALQDYGAYITDSACNNLAFYVEPAAVDEVDDYLVRDLSLLTRYLRVVTNNTEENPGGGGLPRRSVAPPFHAQFR